MNLLQKTKTGHIIVSVLYILLGICLIIFPDQSLHTICLFVGIIALAAGIYKIAYFFFVRIHNVSGHLDLISGIFSVAVGMIFIVRPTFITNLFPVIIGILIIVDSSFKLQSAFVLRSIHTKGWWGIGIFSLIGIIFGFLLIFNPFQANHLALIFIGISMMIDGIENLWTVIYTAHVIKKSAPIEVRYIEIDDHTKKK